VDISKEQMRANLSTNDHIFTRPINAIIKVSMLQSSNYLCANLAELQYDVRICQNFKTYYIVKSQPFSQPFHQQLVFHLGKGDE
jgi:hypothetical protein